MKDPKLQWPNERKKKKTGSLIPNLLIFPLVHIFLSKSGILNCANGRFNATFQGSTNGNEEQSSPKMKVIIKFFDTDVIIQNLSLQTGWAREGTEVIQRRPAQSQLVLHYHEVKRLPKESKATYIFSSSQSLFDPNIAEQKALDAICSHSYMTP